MAYPSGMVLADTSVVHRADRSSTVRDHLDNLSERYLLATCATVDLELGQSARTAPEHQALAELRARLLIDLPLTKEVIARARHVQGLLAARGLHRGVGPADLLIAACAEVHGALVLHYDRDYDHIAAVTGQPAQWLAAPGDLP